MFDEKNFGSGKSQLNVLGEPLEPCSTDPLTGFFRDGCCNTDENSLFTERRVIQEVRSQFSNVVTLVANVNAQNQAVISATSALEATQVGYKVGTRNIVDLLQAEKNLYSAEKNLANAKYDYILANLRLALASGTISPSDIQDISNLLK